MAPTTRAPLIEHLPPVLRGDSPSPLDRFLAAFEIVQRGVEHEVERIPDLFSVVPTAVLAEEAVPGWPTLRLDSAAGLRPGDLLELAGARAEFVVVRELHVAWRAGVRAEAPLPQQPAGTPLWELRPAAAGALAAGAAAGSSSLALRAPPAGSIRLVRVGDEVARVAQVLGHRLELAAPLRHDHGPGTPATALERGAAVAWLLEPATLEHPLIRLEAAVGGVVAGAALELGGRHLVVESAVAEEPAELIPWLVALEAPPRGAYPPRTAVNVIGRALGATVLGRAARAGDAILTVRAPEGFQAVAGDVLALDADVRREFVRIAAVAGAELQLDTALRFDHPAQCPTTRLERSPTTTPAAASFPFAQREGPELVLHASVRRGETWLELDSLSGIGVGELLRFEDVDRAEEVRLAALSPEERSEPAIRSGDVVELADLDPERIERVRVDAVRGTTLDLAGPLRFAHEPGTGLRVVGEPPVVRRVTAVLATRVDAGRSRLGFTEQAGRTRRAVRLAAPLLHDHDAGVALSVATPGRGGAGTAFLRFLAGWIGLTLRPDRGERWNRELLRLAGRIWPWRGTVRGVEAFLSAALRGEAERVRVVDAPDPLQIGLVATVGSDTVIGGMPPHYFLVDVWTESRNSRLYSPVGLREMSQAARAVLRAERPAHTYYDLRVNAYTMQIGVDAQEEIGARVGDTTLLWSAPQIVEGDR